MGPYVIEKWWFWNILPRRVHWRIFKNHTNPHISVFQHNDFKTFGTCLHTLHHFDKVLVSKVEQSYHGAIFNPKSSQKVPKIAILAFKLIKVILNLIFSQEWAHVTEWQLQMMFLDISLKIMVNRMQKKAKTSKN